MIWIRSEFIKEDEEKTQETVTMELMAEIANSIFPFLKFTHEVAQEGMRIPVLDMEVGVQTSGSNGHWFTFNQEDEEHEAPGLPKENEQFNVPQVAYHFYKKPMANPLVILKRSGVPEGTKVATMSHDSRV